MPLREGLLEPIPGDNPCGVDVSNDKAMIQIREARREEEPEGGVWDRPVKTADWKEAQKIAEDTLQKKSKDLWMAAYLTEALVQRDGFEGYLAGLRLVKGLLETYWDNVYPELEDGDAELRGVAVSWVGSKLVTNLRFQPLTAGGHHYFHHREQAGIPTEAQAGEDDNKAQLRATAVAENRCLPEAFNDGLKATPVAQLDALGGTLKAMGEEVESLDAFCQERFGEYAPGFGPLNECLEELTNLLRILKEKKSGPRPAPAPAGSAAARPVAAAAVADEWGAAAAPAPAQAAEEWDAEAAPAAEQAPAPAAAPVYGAAPSYAGGGYMSAEVENAEDAAARVGSVARWLRQQTPDTAAPYLLLRSFRWGELKAVGGTLDWTLLESAPQEVRQNLKKLQQEGDWEPLAEAAEEAMALPCGRAWLDLQRYAIGAAEQLGRRAIAAAIAKELKEVLGEYPQLLESTLTDDMPPANAQTLAFFKERNLLPSQSGAPLGGLFAKKDAAAAEAEAEDDELPIRRALRAGKTEEAVQLVFRRLASETNGRGRFQRKAQLAEILMNADRTSVALPILKELVQEVRDKHLEQWEAPEVVTPPLAMYYKCLSKTGGPEEEKQQIFSLISRLDPVRAFELT